MFGRMLLLRWRRGYLVGAVLAGLALAAVTLGVFIHRIDRSITIAWPTNRDCLALMGLTALMIILGASIVWPIWCMLVHVFLPRETARKVLAWQSFRDHDTPALARQ